LLGQLTTFCPRLSEVFGNETTVFDLWSSGQNNHASQRNRHWSDRDCSAIQNKRRTISAMVNHHAGNCFNGDEGRTRTPAAAPTRDFDRPTEIGD